jgi:hypothetical protein
MIEAADITYLLPIHLNREKRICQSWSLITD